MSEQAGERPVQDPLFGSRVVLGVSGSIAAYKAVTIAGRLTSAGAEVDVVLTRSATKLVSPLTYQAITHRPVVASLWDPVGPAGLDHISLAAHADALVIAPATAHVIARLSLGLADDALTTTALATRAPLIVAPAMEPNMWSNPVTKDHVEALVGRGALLLGPEPGRMASGKHGVGRLADPDLIVEHIRLVLARGGQLEGKRLVVTAGPTREIIDPVRFLTNRSSGRMGYRLAREALSRGATVELISGPVALDPPAGATLIPVETALEMRDAVLAHAPKSDALLMAAAVADYRPADPDDRKRKKGVGDTSIRLTRNPDILLALNELLSETGERPVVVGFAAETERVVENALGKLKEKNLDLVIGNLVPTSFEGETTDAVLVDSDAQVPAGVSSKAELAKLVIDRVAEMITTATIN